jgi:hypothetical protein
MWMRGAIAVVVLGAAFLAVIKATHGAEYGAPDMDVYFDTLMRPDANGTCCGWGDDYYADKVEPCRPEDPVDCALVAVITDTRPDKFEFADGRVINRVHLPVGTKIAVPKSRPQRANCSSTAGNP